MQKAFGNFFYQTKFLTQFHANVKNTSKKMNSSNDS